MKIYWSNIAALILCIVVVVVLLRYRRALGILVGNINHIGPGHTPDEQTLGLIALGIICVSLVAIVRILTRK